jgi:hypothetical protein
VNASENLSAPGNFEVNRLKGKARGYATSVFLIISNKILVVKISVTPSFSQAQKRIVELFGVGVAIISKYFETIYGSGELQRESTISILETVQQATEHRIRL